MVKGAWHSKERAVDTPHSTKLIPESHVNVEKRFLCLLWYSTEKRIIIEEKQCSVVGSRI
jgi:hypothetical protein